MSYVIQREIHVDLPCLDDAALDRIHTEACAACDVESSVLVCENCFFDKENLKNIRDMYGVD